MSQPTINLKDQEKDLREKLYQILLEELSAYDYLYETVSKKKDAIVVNDYKLVEELTGVERVIINKADLLSQTRLSTLDELFEIMGLENRPKTLSNFIEMLPKERQSLWERMNSRLIAAIEKIQRTNDANQRLIKVSLNFVQGMIGLLYPRDDSESQVYDKNGKDSFKLGKNLVNCNA
jgi:flagellar biosynthesis/type III secretory pathway chaperone